MGGGVELLLKDNQSGRLIFRKKIAEDRNAVSRTRRIEADKTVIPGD